MTRKAARCHSTGEKSGLALQESLIGPRDPTLCLTLESLAEVCTARGDLTGSETLYRRSLALREGGTADNQRRADEAAGAAALLRLTNQIDQAERLEARARELREATSESAGSAAVNERFAAVLRRRGRADEAEGLDARARAIRDAVETRAARERSARSAVNVGGYR